MQKAYDHSLQLKQLFAFGLSLTQNKDSEWQLKNVLAYNQPHNAMPQHVKVYGSKLLLKRIYVVILPPKPVMMARAVWIIAFFAFAGMRSGAQCTVSVTAPALNHHYICPGDSTVIYAVDSGDRGAPVQGVTWLHYNHDYYFQSTPGFSVWQSFTDSITGTLTQINIGFSNTTSDTTIGPATIKVFAGRGTGGALLDTRAVTWSCPRNQLVFDTFKVSAPVFAGQVYTFQFIPGPGMPNPYELQTQFFANYPGGDMQQVDTTTTTFTIADMTFATWVQPAPTYLWNTGSTDSAITVRSGGKYYVTSTLNGCTGSDSIEIITDSFALNNRFIAPAASRFCRYDSVSICAATGFANYLWSNGATGSCIEANTVSAFSVVVTDTNGCKAHSNTATVTMNPVVTVTVSHRADTLIATTTAPVTGYQWFYNGQILAPDTLNFLATSNTGNYAVQVTDTNGCVTSSNPYQVTGLHQLPANAVSIYPNPTTNTWQLHTDNSCLGADLTLFDLAGNTLYTGKVSSTEQALQVNLSAGIYLLQISNSLGASTWKLVKL